MSRADEVARRFGANLARVRHRAGLSQEELGHLASIHRTEVGMLERGIRLPRIDTVLKLSGGLEVEPGELLDGMQWLPPGPPREGQFTYAPQSADTAEPRF